MNLIQEQVQFPEGRIDPDAATEAIRRFGCVLIRNAIDAGTVAEAGRQAVAVFDDLDRYGDQGEVPDDIPYKVANGQFHLSLLEGGRHRLRFPMLRALYASTIFDVARRYFGCRSLIIPLRNLPVRRQRPSEPQTWIPFHQDGHTYPRTMPHLKAWSLLYPERAGTDAPGMEFLLGEGLGMIPREENPSAPHYAFLESSHIEIERLKRRLEHWTPVFNHGDVVILDGRLIHRTSAHETMTHSRISSEVVIAEDCEEVRGYYDSYERPYFTLGENGMTGPVEIDWKHNRVEFGVLVPPEG